MKLTRDEHLYFNACAKALLACPEVQSMSAFTQHGRVSCLEHSLSVAYYSYWLCRRLRLRVDGESLIRGALLHDFFLYDWHTVGRQYGLHGFTHPATALKNARQRSAVGRSGMLVPITRSGRSAATGTCGCAACGWP